MLRSSKTGLRKTGTASFSRYSRIWAILTFLLVGAGLVSSLCTGTASLISSSMALEVNGTMARFIPIKSDGSRVQDFLNITLEFTGITERTRGTGSTGCFASPLENTEKRLYMKGTEELDCIVSQRTEYPHPDTRLESLTVNYTDPDRPEFWLSNTFYATSKEFTVFPSSNTTYVDDGQTYSWNFNPGKIKLTYESSNYRWVDNTPAPNASFFSIHWNLGFDIYNSDLVAADWEYFMQFSVNQTRLDGSKLNVELEFEKAFMADGLPHFRRLPGASGVFYALKEATAQNVGPFATGVPVCSPYHWTRMIYDPSIAFVFGAPDTVAAPTDSGRSSAIIAGAVVGSIAAAAVLVVIVLVIAVPKIRYFFMPFSRPRDAASGATNLATPSQSYSQVKQVSQDPDSDTGVREWSAATKPV